MYLAIHCCFSLCWFMMHSMVAVCESIDADRWTETKLVTIFLFCDIETRRKWFKKEDQIYFDIVYILDWYLWDVYNESVCVLKKKKTKAKFVCTDSIWLSELAIKNRKCKQTQILTTQTKNSQQKWAINDISSKCLRFFFIELHSAFL